MRVKGVLKTAGLLCSWIFALRAEAGTTRHFRIDTAKELEAGTLHQVTVTSEDDVRLGRRTERIELKDTALVWSAAKGPDGAVYLGTGYNGMVLKLEGHSVRPIARTTGLMVTAMAWDQEGNLYLATVPEGKIFKVAAASLKSAAAEPVDAQVFATLPEGPHVWALLFDPKRKVFFAATGPNGIIFSVDLRGRAEVYFDSEAEHILCLALDKDGSLLAGSSPKAILMRVLSPGKAVALEDFGATEVKAVAVEAGVIVAGVNTFTTPPIPPTDNALKMMKQVPRPKPGVGEVWRLDPRGGVERLVKREEGHITSLGMGPDGLIYAGMGAEGRVLAVEPGSRRTSTVLDLDERQVLTLIIGKDEWVVGTGDAGSVYRVSSALPEQAEYLTKPLDAGFFATWGKAEWTGGKDFEVESRWGNTAVPDKTWTSWSGLKGRSGSSLGIAAARYVQLKFRWKDPKEILRSIRVFYRPVNQRARVTDIQFEPKFRKKETPGKVTPPAPSVPVPAKPEADKAEGPAADQEKTSAIKISWKADNPDGDPLEYLLSYRAEGEDGWIAITDPRSPLETTSFDWDTESIPSGYYEVKVTASDRSMWPETEALEDGYVSAPVLIDNQPPVVLDLGVKTGIVTGRAADDFGPIDRVEVSMDGGPWRPVPVQGGLLDSARAEFSFTLPAGLTPGPHTLAVRALDLAGNIGTARTSFSVTSK